MTNIKDIARISGVSPSTVSAVLTGRHERVKASTRQRIMDVMREMRYSPRPLFYGDHVDTTTTLGVVFFTNMETDDEEVDPYYLAIIEGVLAVGLRRDCNVVSVPTRSWENSSRTLRACFDGKCNGLLLINPKGTETILDALRERSFPFVLVNSEMEEADCNYVGIDLKQGASMAMEHLIGLGHTRIAFLAGNGVVGRPRERAYLSALKERGLPAQPSFMPQGDYHISSGRERTIELMTSSGERPTALFCETDQIALGALEALRELKIDVPGDVSVIGFDDLALAAASDPPLTTVRRPLAQIGKEAAKLILAQLNGELTQPEKRVFAAELMVRGTTGVARS